MHLMKDPFNRECTQNQQYEEHSGSTRSCCESYCGYIRVMDYWSIAPKSIFKVCVVLTLLGSGILSPTMKQFGSCTSPSIP